MIAEKLVAAATPASTATGRKTVVGRSREGSLEQEGKRDREQRESHDSGTYVGKRCFDGKAALINVRISNEQLETGPVARIGTIYMYNSF